MLDLAGYTEDRDLGALVLVEPSCGEGAFVTRAVERLLRSAGRHGREPGVLTEAIEAFDLSEVNAARARRAVRRLLLADGMDESDAHRLSDAWIRNDDFLLREHRTGSADVVVGNPPYVRLENVSADRMRSYRARCRTMRGRSDLYVGFYEKGLELLRPGGTLAYICADRWMRNAYGTGLRRLIASAFSLDVVIEMHDVNAFDKPVSAYPSVVVARKGRQGPVSFVTTTARFGARDADRLGTWLRGPGAPSEATGSFEAARVDQWRPGEGFWAQGTPSTLAVIADLERRFAPLEDPTTRTRVGIGVATGCDEVYVTYDPSSVEADRLLPLLRAPDTTDGVARWSGAFLINPWSEGRLVDLDAYPLLAAYLDAHGDRIRRRHIAQKRPAQWFRTIDRIDPLLSRRSKLVLPDLKARAHPVLDEGLTYPHHNLYYVVSDVWDLEVLGGLLLSDVTNLFVGSYCVRMRGGCYRFQAQYLRRIRVPRPEAISAMTRQALRRAFRNRDVEAATAVAQGVYGIADLTSLMQGETTPVPLEYAGAFPAAHG